MARQTTFTISQPFLGAPLNFDPALGSNELEQLIDIYVAGTASKQDKLSQVTIDFYNHATVDVNTGALVKTYNVFLSPWTQSPQSQSSGFSPQAFTPSSSSTFGDSRNGSFSVLTPSTRIRGARVFKKSKKDVKKTTKDVRIPGFQIMTKDGVDVTNCAGRGTKTKEQREHAHLMRIMKACADCKRKKTRCDPSHRREQNDMSRSFATTTSSNPSPPTSLPQISRETTQTSQDTAPFTASNPIDDFILFPEEDFNQWNPADMPIPDEEQDYDLSQFNFDINNIDLMAYDMNAEPLLQGMQQPANFNQSFTNNSFFPDHQLSQEPLLQGQLSNRPVIHNSSSQLERNIPYALESLHLNISWQSSPTNDACPQIHAAADNFSPDPPIPIPPHSDSSLLRTSSSPSSSSSGLPISSNEMAPSHSRQRNGHSSLLISSNTSHLLLKRGGTASLLDDGSLLLQEDTNHLLRYSMSSPLLSLVILALVSITVLLFSASKSPRFVAETLLLCFASMGFRFVGTTVTSRKMKGSVSSSLLKTVFSRKDIFSDKGISRITRLIH